MSVLHVAGRRSLRAVAAATLLAGVLVVPAFASGSTATATVSSGSLGMTVGTLTAAGDTLNGTNQTATFSIPVTADDATGSGFGWNLTMGATQFKGTTSALNLLPATALNLLTQPTETSPSGTSPTDAISYPMNIPATATKYFNAAANTGMGTFTETATMTLNIPANTVADTYTSTVTLAIVSAP